MLCSPTFFWPTESVSYWPKNLPLMELGSKILPQGRISDICEKSIIVLITYCNFNDIFIINTIILPYSTLSPKALLITTSYLVSHVVFGTW